MQQSKPKGNMICALCHVSESEVAALDPEYSYEWFDNSNPKYRHLLGLLYDLGIDTEEYIELQPVVQHRNRLGNVVTCGRYVSSERIDTDWVKSGFASREAKDKASGSKLVEELYRSKGLTVDAQLAMEYKDRYSKGEE